MKIRGPTLVRQNPSTSAQVALQKRGGIRASLAFVHVLDQEKVDAVLRDIPKVPFRALGNHDKSLQHCDRHQWWLMLAQPIKWLQRSRRIYAAKPAHGIMITAPLR